MRPHIKQLSFRFLNKAASTRQQDRGYALLILMMAVTILLVSLTAALPSIYVEGQREREEELIFRGNQYARAIAFFHRRFNRYPTSVKELLRTNGMRFLRRAYADPMSRDGKWRFIHSTANGIALDSRTLTAPTTPPNGTQQMPPENLTPTPSPRTRRRPSGIVEETSEERGAFIMGVASMSEKESIRVWKDRTHYDEWEFLGSEVAPIVLPGVSRGRPGASGRPNAPPSSFPPGRRMPPAPSPGQTQQ